jgi:transposase
MGSRGYPAEFRRKVLDLLAEGRSVASVANDLDVSDQTIYSWRKQDRIDRGLVPGLSTKEAGELAVARERISELENELAVAQRAVDLLKEQTSPNGGTRRSK